MHDTHLHSSFSFDGKMAFKEACDRGIKLGLSGLTFTDHLDIDYPVDPWNSVIDFDEYFRCLDEVKSSYSGQLEVLKGVEVGIQPGAEEKSADLVKKYDFDLVINSVHVIEGQDPYFRLYFQGRTRDEAYGLYLKAVLESLDLFGDFDVMGHIGYLARYTDYQDRVLKYGDFPQLMEEILKKLVSMGKGLEVNSSGYRCDLGSPIPGCDIIRRFLELGGEIITLGSDAHRVEHIAHGFEAVREGLKAMGVKYAACYKNRKPVFYRL